jgi:hypothetical protein
VHVAPESELSLLLAHVPPEVTGAEFRRCRNDIVRALARFGSVGPTGVLDENDDEVESYGNGDADFFVVDDMYNDEQRLHLIETLATRVIEPLLESLTQAVSHSPHWAAHLAIGDAGLYVFADRVVPCGRRFWDCDSVGAIADRCSRPVEFGPAPDSWADGYEIWHDLVCGAWYRDQLPTGPDRQWAYVINYLSQTKPITEFTYRNRILYDLHPATRLEFVSRFLEEFGDGRETSTVGIETVAEDAGQLLLHLEDASSIKLLNWIATAQARLAPNDAFYFWTKVIYAANKGGTLKDAVSKRLASFLLAKVPPPNAELISLSALLGLACIKHPEVSEQAARLSLQNDHWGASVHAWLRQLSANRDAYPYPSDEIDLSSLR